jgi:hypothetical protein
VEERVSHFGQIPLSFLNCPMTVILSVNIVLRTRDDMY